MRRVVLAGLLARSPRVLILDEPLAGLDAASQRGLVRLLTDRRRETGLTVVVISHDFAGLEELCPRTLHLRDGVLKSDVGRGPGNDVPATPPAKRRTRRPPRPVVLLRPVPGRSPIHELWAGTKLIVVFGISVLLTFYPGWAAIGLLAATCWSECAASSYSPGVLPRCRAGSGSCWPSSGITALLAGGSPVDPRGHGLARSRRPVGFLASHRAVDRVARPGRAGVVDYQCRRNRSCGGHSGSSTATVADPGRRLGGRISSSHFAAHSRY